MPLDLLYAVLVGLLAFAGSYAGGRAEHRALVERVDDHADRLKDHDERLRDAELVVTRHGERLNHLEG